MKTIATIFADFDNLPKDKEFCTFSFNPIVLQEYYMLYGIQGISELVSEIKTLGDLISDLFEYTGEKIETPIGILNSPIKKEKKDA
jgi:hypothetical protein